jgi:hypothetical protein
MEKSCLAPSGASQAAESRMLSQTVHAPKPIMSSSSPQGRHTRHGRKDSLLVGMTRIPSESAVFRLRVFGGLSAPIRLAAAAASSSDSESPRSRQAAQQNHPPPLLRGTLPPLPFAMLPRLSTCCQPVDCRRLSGAVRVPSHDRDRTVISQFPADSRAVELEGWV